MFVKTDTILDQILAQKQEELHLAQAEVGLMAQVEEAARHAPHPRDFKAALQRSTVALIAEVKKASPSKGLLVKDFNPVRIARTYEENGAAAISVLTDAKFFQTRQFQHGEKRRDEPAQRHAAGKQVGENETLLREGAL